MPVSDQITDKFPLVTGILSIILGLVCVVSPQIKMESIAIFFGFVILIYGIFEIAAGILTKDNAQARTLQILVGIVASVLAIDPWFCIPS